MDRRFLPPPVRGLFNLEPWEQPQTLLRGPGQVPPPGGRPLLNPGVGGGPTSPVQPPPIWQAEAHRYASFINLLLPVDTTSAKVLNMPATYRNFLAFRNVNTTAILYLQFGSDATDQSVFSLQPGQTLAFDAVVPQDDVYCLSDTAGQTLSLLYSTIALPAQPTY